MIQSTQALTDGFGGILQRGQRIGHIAGGLVRRIQFRGGRFFHRATRGRQFPSGAPSETKEATTPELVGFQNNDILPKFFTSRCESFWHRPRLVGPCLKFAVALSRQLGPPDQTSQAYARRSAAVGWSQDIKPTDSRSMLRSISLKPTTEASMR